MAEYSSNQKNKLLRKLKLINITSEKDILNMKVSELKKIKLIDDKQTLTIKDVEIIWLIQDAIENKKIFEFFADDTN